MKQLPLSRGLFAIVDDQDFDRLNQWKWHARPSSSGFTAVRVTSRSSIAHMHRVVLGTGCSEIVTCVDGNYLNCQRSNLVLDTKQSLADEARKLLLKAGKQRPSRYPMTSKYKGVHWSKPAQKWRAKFRSKHIGVFNTQEAAADAYDLAALAYNAEVAMTNRKFEET